MNVLERIVGDLGELGPIAVRPMFGGHGVYWRDVIFGMAFGGRLYFKVDGQWTRNELSPGWGVR